MLLRGEICYLSLVFRNQLYLETIDHNLPGHAKFVEDAICELVESGCVLEVVVPPLVVNPLSVSVKATVKKI